MKNEKISTSWKRGKPILITILSIIIMIILIDKIGLGSSLLVYLLFVLVVSIYRLYRARDLFMMNLRILESKIFGKPLDRDTWKKGELKRTKIKIVWKKPDQKKPTTTKDITYKDNLDEEYRERLDSEIIKGE